jgi:hypothetical protein
MRIQWSDADAPLVASRKGAGSPPGKHRDSFVDGATLRRPNVTSLTHVKGHAEKTGLLRIY